MKRIKQQLIDPIEQALSLINYLIMKLYDLVKVCAAFKHHSVCIAVT